VLLNNILIDLLSIRGLNRNMFKDLCCPFSDKVIQSMQLIVNGCWCRCRWCSFTILRWRWSQRSALFSVCRMLYFRSELEFKKPNRTILYFKFHQSRSSDYFRILMFRITVPKQLGDSKLHLELQVQKSIDWIFEFYLFWNIKI